MNNDLFKPIQEKFPSFGGGKQNEEREKDEDREEVEGNMKCKVEFRKL